MEYRTINGYGNNIDNPEWGAADAQFIRYTSPYYEDDTSEMLVDRPNPRAVSNLVSDQEYSIPNAHHLSNLFIIWGQFLDHDITLTHTNPDENADITIPVDDPHFNPEGEDGVIMPFHRSAYDPTTGTDAGNPREYNNAITGFIDGSMVYGSDDTLADALRDTGGKLKLTSNDYLPIEDTPQGESFLAGDVRANENVGLTSLHTVFAREHNYWVDKLADEDPSLSDEELYQEARSIVIAEIQKITYDEFLPKLLGSDALPDYQGYDADIDPSLSLIFSTTAYRFGHSMISDTMARYEKDGDVSSDGHLALKDSFFNSVHLIRDEDSMDDVIRGMAAFQAEELDTKLVDGLRNFLFGPPGAGGLDLATLNIQRSYDHGLPSYNVARELFGLSAASDFGDVTSNPALQTALEEAYGTIDKLDIWVGGLAEDHEQDAMIGELFHTIITDQFLRLRDGDRFWHENDLKEDYLEEISNTSLSDILQRNTDIDYLQSDVMTYYDRIGGTNRSEYLEGSENHDLILAFGGRDTLEGDSGADDLYGGYGKDTLYGNRGNDILFGGRENDVLYGGKDQDTLYGGKGKDELLGDWGNDLLYGEDGKDELYGGIGHDTLYGGKADDELSGEAGDDVLYGNEEDDELYGNEGSDSLHGGSGEDYMEGGAGHDIFYFNYLDDSTHATTDDINDFTQGEDVINVSALGFTSIEFTEAYDSVLGYEHHGDYTYVYGDNDFAVYLNGNFDLTNDDFIF